MPDAVQGGWDRLSYLHTEPASWPPTRGGWSRPPPPSCSCATDGDRPADWVRAGCALQRVLLTAAADGLTASYFNQPTEVARLRPDVSALAGGGHAQVMFRLGTPIEATARPGAPSRTCSAPTTSPPDQRSPFPPRLRAPSPTVMAVPVHRILFPTDFSACAEGAYRHAAWLAERFGAELHVLHVVEDDVAPERDWPDAAGTGHLQISLADVCKDLGLPTPSPDGRITTRTSSSRSSRPRWWAGRRPRPSWTTSTTRRSTWS